MDLRAVSRLAATAFVATLAAAGCRATPRAAESAGEIPPSVRYDQHLFAGGFAPAGADAKNPYAGDAKSATQGGKLFVAMNCNGCHGDGATGFLGSSLSDGRWRYGGSDAADFQSIYYGRPQGMPAFGGMLQPEIIWKLVTYLRSLPKPQGMPTQAW